MSAARTDDPARPTTARPPLRSSALYLVPGIAVILALAAAVALFARAEGQRLVDEMAATSFALTSVLADHSDRLFESADLIRLQVQDIVGVDDPIVADRARHTQLARLVEAVPHVTSIWVGDAEGTAVLTSREYPTPTLSAADRRYFTAVRDKPDALFTGTLSDNRYVDEVLINTSRRLSRADGSFRGFIQVAINPINLRRTFAHVQLPYQTALWLFNADGEPLLREPYLPSDALPTSVPRGVDIASLSGTGMFSAVSGVDGTERRFFYTQAPEYGAYVLIVLHEDELRALWRERALPIVGIGGLLVVALAAILAFVHRERTSGLRWAVAGRTATRLQAVQQACGAAQPGVVVADAADTAALDRLAAQAHVVLSTAGPFARHGSELVAACVRHGTHYVDITGETPWVRDMIDRHHEAAARQGTRIVPGCGFDSVPSDLGAWLVAQALWRRHGERCTSVKACFSLRGGLNGGTFASLVNMLETGRSRELADPFLLNPPGTAPADPLPHADPRHCTTTPTSRPGSAPSSWAPSIPAWCAVPWR